VRAYGKRPNVKAPLSVRIHEELHDAAANELRFALKLGHDIVTDLNARMYEFIEKRYRSEGRTAQRAAMLRDLQALLRERMAGADTFPDDQVELAIERACIVALSHSSDLSFRLKSRPHCRNCLLVHSR
jgi:hypothetical protein